MMTLDSTNKVVSGATPVLDWRQVSLLQLLWVYQQKGGSMSCSCQDFATCATRTTPMMTFQTLMPGTHLSFQEKSHR